MLILVLFACCFASNEISKLDDVETLIEKVRDKIPMSAEVQQEN